jgi:integrase/recombinase XerD
VKPKRRRGRDPRPKPDRATLRGMWGLREDYLEHLKARNYAADTLRGQNNDLKRFLTWCDERSLIEATDITQPIVEQYQRWLFYYRKRNGLPLSVKSQHHILSTLRTFFRWLTRRHVIALNPVAELELPRVGHQLPRSILTAAEVDVIVRQVDVTTALGLRDRAILETFYATGIRRKELASLCVFDVDANRKTVMIRQGKGRKDRLIPIGQRALDWIDSYMVKVRPQLIVDPDEEHLFLTADGARFKRLSSLSQIANQCMVSAGITKKSGCHLFRHTVATLMLENGADIRYIQELLGHSTLASTQVYTHVSIGKLQQVYQATHPAEQGRPAAKEDNHEPVPKRIADLNFLDDDDDEEQENDPDS